MHALLGMLDRPMRRFRSVLGIQTPGDRRRLEQLLVQYFDARDRDPAAAASLLASQEDPSLAAAACEVDRICCAVRMRMTPSVQKHPIKRLLEAA